MGHQTNLLKQYYDLRILVIDDEVIIARDIKETLDSFGFNNICTANNSTEARRLALDLKPSLIFCDINLRDKINGIEVVKQLREQLPDMEVIYISAYTDLQIVEEAQQTAPVNYLVKPFSKEQFKIAISFALNKIRAKTKHDVNLDKLTDHEIKILHLIRQNYDTKKIAEVLFISDKTVRNHRYNICKKLDIPPEKNSLLKWTLTHLNSI